MRFERGGGAAAFFDRPLVVAAGRVRIDLVGWAVHDVDAAAIGFPARYAAGKMLVGVSDAAIVFFLVVIGEGFRIGVAAQPELLDELLALFIILEASEDLPLLIGDDVADIVAQPLPVGPLQLFLKGLLLAGFVFVG